MKNKLKNYKHFSLFIWLFMLTLLYFLTNKLNKQIYRTDTIIDDYIPFVKYMVIPYISYYFYLWGTYIYLAFRHKELFRIHVKINILCYLICIVVFLVYPTYVVRPEIEITDVFTKLINMIYNRDNPVNALPSLHVLQSVLTHIAITKIPNINKGIKITSFIITVMIILSTVMIKQHYILDGIAGLTIGLATANATYKLYNKKYAVSRDITLF